MADYTLAQQQSWKEELHAQNNPDSFLHTITNDYIGLRDANRACLKIKEGIPKQTEKSWPGKIFGF